MRKVHWVSSSSDKKIGKVLASYSTKDSCPDTCTLKSGGCYAWGLFYLNILSQKIDSGRINRKSLSDAMKDRTSTSRIVRHRVAGDVVGDVKETVDECRTVESAGLTNIGYTHTWREPDSQPLKKWFRASCQSFEELELARSMGWATTLIMNESSIPSKKFVMKNGESAFLCPARIGEKGKKDITCNDCTLCKVDEKTYNKTVVFAAHGSASTMKKIINKI
jgi:hypothetical protein